MTGHYVIPWTDRAECAQGYPPEWWHVDNPQKLIRANMAALAICNVCPVRRECRTDAAKRPPSYGGMIAAGRVWNRKLKHGDDYGYRLLTSAEAERFVRHMLRYGLPRRTVTETTHQPA